MEPFSLGASPRSLLLFGTIAVIVGAATLVPGGPPWPVLFLPLVVVLAIGADWFVSSLELDAAGVLSQHTLGGTQHVDLSLLVRAERRMVREGDRDTRLKEVWELTDERGGHMTLEPRRWADKQRVLGAVLAAAAARGVEVDDAPAPGSLTLSDALAVASHLWQNAGIEGESPPAPPDVAGEPWPVPGAGELRPPRGLVTGVLVRAGLTMLVGAVLLAGPVLVPEAYRVAAAVLLPVPGVVLALVGLTRVLAAVNARVRLDADGLLTVRRGLFAVNLRLDRVDHVLVARRLSLRRRPPTLALLSRSAGRVGLDVGTWMTPPHLLQSIGAWAQRAGAQADPEVWTYLRTGRPPDLGPLMTWTWAWQEGRQPPPPGTGRWPRGAGRGGGPPG
jgi:hypothetical protein